MSFDKEFIVVKIKRIGKYITVFLAAVEYNYRLGLRRSGMPFSYADRDCNRLSFRA